MTGLACGFEQAPLVGSTNSSSTSTGTGGEAPGVSCGSQDTVAALACGG